MANEPPRKVRWADLDDEEELELPVVISKHGVKVKKTYVPPHLRPDKTTKRIETKQDGK